MLSALLDEGGWPTPVFAELVVSDRLLVTDPATLAGLEQLATYLPHGPGDVDGDVRRRLDPAPGRCGGFSLSGGLAFGLERPTRPLGGRPATLRSWLLVVAQLDALGRRPAKPEELRARLGRDPDRIKAL